MRDYRFKVAMVANELQGALRSDFGDGIDIVAAKEDAEVDKLVLAVSCWHNL